MRLWCALLLSALVQIASVAHAQTGSEGPAPAGYEELVREGLQEFEVGNYVEARALFEQAHVQKPNARTLRGLGFCAFELKHYLQAVSELEAALAETRNALTPAMRDDVTRALERARRFIGKIILAAQPEDASLVLDGRPVAAGELPVDAGDHTLAASAPGHHSSEQKITVDGGQTVHASVRLLPLDLSPPRAASETANAAGLQPAGTPERDTAERPSVFSKWWFWTAVGVVVAGAVTGTALALESGDSKQTMSNAGSTHVLLRSP